jgi:DNA-binding beta-propeller fold protein YncE
MYRLFLLTLLLASGHSTALWQVEKGLKNPESTYFDADSGFIFVSNVAGDPSQTDGNGWISKLSKEGKVLSEKWVSGLNAPKGLRSREGYLWVTDIQSLLKIDIKSGIIVLRVLIPSAQFLNDLAFGPDGVLYISDTLASRIYEYRDSKVGVFAEGESLESPNGLLVVDGKLVVAAWGFTRDFKNATSGRLYSLDLKTKAQAFITPAPVGNLDGLEQDGSGFLVSDWVAGKVLRIDSSGAVEVLFSGFKGAADIGWIAGERVLLVPRMGEDRVSAFTIIKKS